MAGEQEDQDALSQEELDALDEGEGEDGAEEGDDQEGDGEDEVEPGLDAGDEEGEEGRQNQARQGQGQDGAVKGRAGGRIARLAKELKEARAEAKRDREEFERRLTGLGQPQQQTQVDPRLEAERLAAMTPEERISEQLRQSDQRHQAEMLRMQLTQADREDLSAYRTRGATDPRAKKYEPEVEKLLGQFRQNGMNPKREALYFYLLGQKVANAKSQGTRQRQEGQERVRRQTTRPSNAGSDTPARRGGKTLEQRLDGVSI